jgi:hypothetical protein
VVVIVVVAVVIVIVVVIKIAAAAVVVVVVAVVVVVVIVVIPLKYKTCKIYRFVTMVSNAILDSIHRPDFYLKYDVSDTGFYLRNVLF